MTHKLLLSLFTFVSLSTGQVLAQSFELKDNFSPLPSFDLNKKGFSDSAGKSEYGSFPERKLIPYTDSQGQQKTIREADFEYALRLESYWKSIALSVDPEYGLISNDADTNEAVKNWQTENLVQFDELLQPITAIGKLGLFRADAFPAEQELVKIHEQVLQFKADSDRISEFRLELLNLRVDECSQRTSLQCVAPDLASIQNIPPQQDLVSIHQKRYFNFEIVLTPSREAIVSFVALKDGVYEELSELSFEEEFYVQIELPEPSADWARVVNVEVQETALEIVAVKVSDQTFRSIVPIVLKPDLETLVQP